MGHRYALRDDQWECIKELLPVCPGHVGVTIKDNRLTITSQQDLPIGSGEIESAHRYLIQKRLKLPGAWWLAVNAENMLALRVNRANGEWHNYWATHYRYAA